MRAILVKYDINNLSKIVAL